MKKAEWNNTLAAVAVGIVSPVVVALVLFPLVRIILNKYFHLYLFVAAPPDAWKDDMIVEITVYVWVLIAFLAGGFFCAWIAKRVEFRSIILSIFISFVVANLVTKGHLFEADRMSIIVQLLNPIGYLTGWRIAMRYKQGKYKEAEPTF
ncbi:MAG TPA: hypothetical protein VFP87_00725 [Chitinophagaceae bacterium]|nr:hypothetical protein [Chitinophagaceae bacterium]